jgi:hypothetical protein
MFASDKLVASFEEFMFDIFKKNKKSKSNRDNIKTIFDDFRDDATRGGSKPILEDFKLFIKYRINEIHPKIVQ